MIGLFSLFIVVFASLLITRVATVMLTLTGLSQEVSEFQARSAFSGVGFTTTESESVMGHPVRRRIIMTLVLLGNAGVVTALVSLLASFNEVDDAGDAILRLGILTGGLLALWLIARTAIASRFLTRIIEALLVRFTDLDTRDYVGLLRLADSWVVAELEISKGDWLCDIPLSDLDLPHEGVVVLGIDRKNKHWVGAPSGRTAMHDGDVAVLYGTGEAIERLDRRNQGTDGELDRITSEIEYTEQFLEQQELERPLEETAETEERDYNIADAAILETPWEPEPPA
ncbi:MAG: TrkA C-terminal domain-containing protein [Acidimicrobiales bacterium]|nr:TrkA C-terminal domain-containing protein [Acidimicrobiales bacterium]